jgi:tetratricopeptide (TPR) repeat protein
LTNLARVLLKSYNPVDKRQGWRLLEAASKAGSISAVTFSVKQALKQKQLHLPIVAPALRQLDSIVSQGKDVSALVLGGKIYESQGKLAEALRIYKKATTLKDATITSKSVASEWEDAEDMDLDICTAWLGIANIHLKVDPKFHHYDAAIEALRIAALDYDDPSAYAKLAAFQPKCTAPWLEYRLKAAASGHGESAFELGLLYALSKDQALAIEDTTVRGEVLKNPCSQMKFMGRGMLRWWSRATNNVPKNERPDEEEFLRKQLAIRWHEVAFRAGHYESGLELAKLFWGLGDAGCAAEWGRNVLTLWPKLLESRWPRLQSETRKAMTSWSQEGRWKLWTNTFPKEIMTF